jgi:cysteine desulfurase/selenocysteine lyase
MKSNSTEFLPIPTVTTGLPVENIRGDFPMLGTGDSRPIAYLDNPYSSLKPRPMIDRFQEFYSTEYAHPGEVHEGSRHVTELLEQANILALSFARGSLQEGDEVVITAMEHVANNVIPWQLICADAGAKLRVVPLEVDGTLTWIHSVST